MVNIKIKINKKKTIFFHNILILTQTIALYILRILVIVSHYCSSSPIAVTSLDLFPQQLKTWETWEYHPTDHRSATIKAGKHSQLWNSEIWQPAKIICHVVLKYSFCLLIYWPSAVLFATFVPITSASCYFSSGRFSEHTVIPPFRHTDEASKKARKERNIEACLPNWFHLTEW